MPDRKRNTAWVKPGVAVAGLVLGGALVALGTTGWSRATTKSAAPPVRRAGPAAVVPASGGNGPAAPLWVDYDWTGGRLKAVDITVNPSFPPNASVQLEVMHAWSPTARGETVYTTDVSTHKIPACATPLVGPTGRYGPTGCNATGGSTWSGALDPRDWSGGCQSGVYWIYAYSVEPGTPLAEALADPHFGNRETDTAGRFSCDKAETTRLENMP